MPGTITNAINIDDDTDFNANTNNGAGDAVLEAELKNALAAAMAEGNTTPNTNAHGNTSSSNPSTPPSGQTRPAITPPSSPESSVKKLSIIVTPFQTIRTNGIRLDDEPKTPVTPNSIVTANHIFMALNMGVDGVQTQMGEKNMKENGVKYAMKTWLGLYNAGQAF